MTLTVDDARHGTMNGYANLKCRCQPCRDAWAAYHSAWRRRTGYRPPGVKPREQYLAEVMAPHGTEASYKRCRCDECREAANAGRRKRRRHPNVARHGLNNSYSSGCRCDECRQAHTVYERERLQRRRAQR